VYAAVAGAASAAAAAAAAAAAGTAAGYAGSAVAPAHAHANLTEPSGTIGSSRSQLTKPLLQLSGRVLCHGGIAPTDVLAIDPDVWNGALPCHIRQKTLHVMAVSSLVELHYSRRDGQADEELLRFRAEAAPSMRRAM